MNKKCKQWQALTIFETLVYNGISRQHWHFRPVSAWCLRHENSIQRLGVKCLKWHGDHCTSDASNTARQRKSVNKTNIRCVTAARRYNTLNAPLTSLPKPHLFTTNATPSLKETKTSRQNKNKHGRTSTDLQCHRIGSCHSQYMQESNLSLWRVDKYGAGRRARWSTLRTRRRCRAESPESRGRRPPVSSQGNTTRATHSSARKASLQPA